MCKTLKGVLIFLLFPVLGIYAQSDSQQIRTFKFGKVDLEEFKTTVIGPDSATAAIKLFDVGSGRFEISRRNGQFVYAFTRHVRYKVVNKNAYDLADFDVNLYNSAGSSAREELLTIKAATYNLVDGKIEVSKMTGDAKFTNRVDKNHVVKKFTLPNVKEGSIIEYTYNTQSDFIFALDDWYFQGKYPTKYTALTFTTPEYLKYKVSTFGYLDVIQLRPEVNLQAFNIPATSESNAGILNVNVTRQSYHAMDVPAIKDESFITTLEDYVSKMTFEMTATNFPSSGYKDFGSTWPKLINELSEEENFGKFIRRNNVPKGYLADIVKDEKDSLKQLQLIFDHVKKGIKWNSKNALYTGETSPGAVLTKKTGNTADLNLTLLVLLRTVGIKAYPILLSTRGNGIHPGYPLISKFNNVIIEAELGGQNILLDATDEDNVAGLISFHNLNHAGFKIDFSSVSGAWTSLDRPDLSRSSVTYVVALTGDNQFKGNLYQSASNYEGIRRRGSYKAAATEAEFLKNYKAKKPGLDIISYKADHLNEADQDLVESLEITMEDQVESAGDMLYFSPFFYERTKENPFSLEEREFPVDFGFPFEDNFRLTLDYPANYKLDKLPKNEAFSLPEDGGTFSILYNADGNKIAIRSKILIKRAVYSPEEYHALKELYKNIVRKQAEQIVFKKI